MSKILIVDANNIFGRYYFSSPLISKTNGQPIGGLVGFLRCLQRMIELVQPFKIFVVFDGPGYREVKQFILSEYKDGSKQNKPNRNIEVLNKEQEKKNKQWQLLRLGEYLNQFPVYSLMIEKQEADDLIAFLCSLFKKHDKIILSSDRDFFQLLDEKCLLITPDEQVVTPRTVLDEFFIHPNNFALAKSIVGDNSDHIKGIYDIGFKRLVKNFPFFREERFITPEEIKKICEDKKDDTFYPKTFKKILDDFEVVEKNLKVIDLKKFWFLSNETKEEISKSTTLFKPEFNKTGLIKLLLEDGLDSGQFSDLVCFSNKLIRDYGLDLRLNNVEIGI